MVSDEAYINIALSMVHSYESFRPSASYSGLSFRSRSSSSNRYSSSPASSRAGTPLAASYGAPSFRPLQQETTGSSRRSAFKRRDSPAPVQKHVHFKEEKETISLIRDHQGTSGLEPMQGFNRERESSVPRPALEGSSNSRKKMSIREKFVRPSANSDACRRRQQARATYLSTMDDIGIRLKSKDTM